MSRKQDGIVMANGIVLKDGLNQFKANREMIEKSMSHIAKISKGLYSGVLNFDPDFVKFQQESIDNLIKTETEKLSSGVVLGAEKQLRRISDNGMAAKMAHYVYSRRASINNKDIQEIDLSKEDPKENNLAACDLIKEKGNQLASLNTEELEYVKQVNKEAKKILKMKEKIKVDIKISKKKAKKKVSKKKAKKKISKKIAIQSNKVVITK